MTDAEGGFDQSATTPEQADVAAMFATAWNTINNDRSAAAEFWPCCRVLADAGLLAPQETKLTAIPIGPFRLAVSKDNKPLVDFIEVLFPSVIASTATGQAVIGAVSGVLTAACTTFVKLYRQGTVFGRGEVDRLRWEILMIVHTENTHDVQPSREMMVVRFTSRSSDSPSESEVSHAIDWLLGRVHDHEREPRSPLLVQLDNGGLRTTV